jgi:hypothetical protein
MLISIIRDDCGATAAVLRAGGAFRTANVVFAAGGKKTSERGSSRHGIVTNTARIRECGARFSRLLDEGALAAAALRISGTSHIGSGVG